MAITILSGASPGILENGLGGLDIDDQNLRPSAWFAAYI